MSNIAIIPARSGSKGLVDKNIRELNGIPLVGHTIIAAKKSELFDEIMVSTDSEFYKEIALKFGAKVPFLRSKANSNDNSSSWDAVKEVLDSYSKINIEFKTVFLLQPTSPLRDENDIKDAFKLYIQKRARFVVSVSMSDCPPQWVNLIGPGLNMKNFVSKEYYNKPRQDLDQFYRINGGIYIIDKEFLLNESYYYTNRSYAFIMDKSKSIDIDDQYDFMLADAILKSR